LFLLAGSCLCCGFGPTPGGAYGLAVAIRVYIPGVEPETVRALAEAAHQVCPYSNATRGNIDVTVTAG
jgi:organic hydroperoxide reductase OsmC/OhrA